MAYSSDTGSFPFGLTFLTKTCLMADPVEIYLRDLRDIRSTGAAVKETSYYSPLANLFNEIGKTLKPKVRCIINLANRGAGLPDGGFFTPDQFQRASELEPLLPQNPLRGVLDVKGTGCSALTLTASQWPFAYA